MHLSAAARRQWMKDVSFWPMHGKCSERRTRMQKNYYVILGVSSDATLEEIKSAFRQRAMELHPDRSGKESAPFLEVQEAYNVLSDATQRRRYDRLAREHHSAALRNARAEPF